MEFIMWAKFTKMFSSIRGVGKFLCEVIVWVNIHVVTVAVFRFQGERKFKNIDHTKIYTPLGCNIRPRIGRKYIMMGKKNNKITTLVQCDCNSNTVCSGGF